MCLGSTTMSWPNPMWGLGYLGIPLGRRSPDASNAPLMPLACSGIVSHWRPVVLHVVQLHAEELANFGSALRTTMGPWGAILTQAKLRKGLHQGQHDIDGDKLPRMYEVLLRIGRRAAALANEKQCISDLAVDADALRCLKEAMEVLAGLSSCGSRMRSTLDRWAAGQEQPDVEHFRSMSNRVEKELHALSGRRARRRLRDGRNWAERATASTAHKVTKRNDVVTRFSASACKAHLGAGSPQDAADEGADEWAGAGRAEGDDGSGDMF